MSLAKALDLRNISQKLIARLNRQGKEQDRARSEFSPSRGFRRKSLKEDINGPSSIKRNRLRHWLDKSGVDTEAAAVTVLVWRFCIFLNLALSAYVIYHEARFIRESFAYGLVLLLVLWTLALGLIMLLVWLAIYVVMDLTIYRRRTDLEEVLPDFLQLTSANIRAGMTIDKALWYAVRPRFGVLAKEIETVAKETMSGEDLNVALVRFTDKYESKVLKRSIALLIESLEAGGEVGALLDKISSNIQQTQLMKKEMAANVMTYAIFIMFASLTAAPFLYALALQLLTIITEITTNIDMPKSAGASMPLAFTEVGISASEFRIFSIVGLCITALFSALIIATIRKGDIRGAVTYIPVFIGVSLCVYLASVFFLSMFFTTMV